MQASGEQISFALFAPDRGTNKDPNELCELNCWWCRHAIDAPWKQVKYLPVELKRAITVVGDDDCEETAKSSSVVCNNYRAVGAFCSWECVSAYDNVMCGHKYGGLVRHLRLHMDNIGVDEPLASAPHPEVVLKAYGGVIETIAEYRKRFTNIHEELNKLGVEQVQWKFAMSAVRVVDNCEGTDQVVATSLLSYAQPMLNIDAGRISLNPFLIRKSAASAGAGAVAPRPATKTATVAINDRNAWPSAAGVSLQAKTLRSVGSYRNNSTQPARAGAPAAAPAQQTASSSSSMVVVATPPPTLRHAPPPPTSLLQQQQQSKKRKLPETTTTAAAPPPPLSLTANTTNRVLQRTLNHHKTKYNVDKTRRKNTNTTAGVTIR